MNIQQKIKYLNNNLVSELLTIPKSILDTNKNDNEKLNLFFNYMVDRKIKFTGSKQPLHPNLVKFLVDNEICTRMDSITINSLSEEDYVKLILTTSKVEKDIK